MLRIKQKENLQNHCLYSILTNLDHHCIAYRNECKGEICTSYTLLHRHYTEQMIGMLRSKKVIPDSMCPTAHNDFICFDFQDDETKPREEDYWTFLLNPFTKILNLRSYSGPRSRTLKLTKAVLQTIQTAAQNLTIVDLHLCEASREDLSLLLQSIPKVRILQLSGTRCSDEHMDIISKRCHTLKRLDISDTEVTDEGIKHLCGGASQTNEGSCKINFLNIKSTHITYKGLKMIVESLVFLEELQYFEYHDLSSLNRYRRLCRSRSKNEKNRHTDISETPSSMFFGGLAKILCDLNKQAILGNDLANVRKCNLKKLLIGNYDSDGDILKYTPICCPEVTSLVIDSTIPPRYISFCTAYSHLTNMKVSLKDTVPYVELLELIASHRNTLQVLALTGENEAHFPDYLGLLHTLELCSKLKEFTLGDVILEELPNAATTVTKSSKLKCLSTSLEKVLLCGLRGSGLNEFLPLLLSASSHVRILYITASHGVYYAMRKATAVHGFKHLKASSLEEI